MILAVTSFTIFLLIMQTETLNFNTEPENQEAKEEERSLHR